MKQFRSFLSPLSLGEVSRGRSVRLLLLASLFLASCGEQTELDQPGITGGETVEVTQEIQINVLPIQSVGGATTRSAAAGKPEKGESIGVSYNDAATTRVQEGTTGMNADESKINNAYILHFDGTAPTSKLKKKYDITSAQLTGGSPISTAFTMTAGVKNRVYVVANVPSTRTLTEGTTTLQDFEKPVTFAPRTTLSTGLPMSAVQDIGVGDVVDVFQLKSVLAKLKLTCATPSAVLKLKGLPSGYSFYTQTQPGDNAVRPNGMTYNNVFTLTSGTTYYVPENLSGRNKNLSVHAMRALGFASVNALYAEITNSGTAYNLLLGDGSVQDFNFAGGYSYNIMATIYGTDTRDLRVGNRIPAGSNNDPIIDLVTELNGQTANCYVATAANAWYLFDGTVMGNGATTPATTYPAITPSKLNPAKAEVLWEESVNTSTAHANGTIIPAACLFLKDRILFKSGSTVGNAVIAAKDASNTILWSWHIWRINDTPAGVPLASITNGSDFTISDLTLMDRNLGALHAAPNTGVTKEQDYGLFYQWGRKDPFQTQIGVTSAEDSSITPADAVKNPTTFYIGDVYDWTKRNDNLWGCPLTGVVTINTKSFNKNSGSKSIYDPCPVGWKVMPAYTFANATKDNSPWNGTNKGRDFNEITTFTGAPFFFPASGYRHYKFGSMDKVGTSGYYWTSAPNASIQSKGNLLEFSEYEQDSAKTNSRASGYRVRCVRN